MNAANFNELSAQLQKDCNPDLYAQATSNPTTGKPADDASQYDWLFKKPGDFTEALKQIQYREAVENKIAEYIDSEKYQEAFDLPAALISVGGNRHGETMDFATREAAYALIFLGKFKESLAFSEEVLGINPDDLKAQIIKAHALMFLDRPEEAKAIYLSLQYKEILSRKGSEIIKANFVQFRQARKTKPLMTEMQTALR